MRKLVLTFLTITTLLANAGAQTLFTFGGTPVSKQEFLRVYQKNALNKKPDMSDAALKEYFDLYTLFRMKVREAELRRLDTMPSIQRELDNYRKQLAKTYLTDEQVTNKLMKEAYNRMKEERHVAHILIMAPPNMNQDDTLKIAQRMDSIYNALTKNKASFDELAAKYSEDNGSKSKGGDIGFMTALQTLYPFENAVYETEVGKISKPFRTQLGYHIVKVMEKRPARGEIQVAHILLTTPKSMGEDGVKLAEKRMDSIQNALKKGVPFGELAKKYSQDKYSVNEGGVLKPFGVGRMTPAFENAAFALKNPGDVSPVIKTDYGFHIIKLMERMPVKPYDSMEGKIKKLVENDSRAQMARDIFFEKMKAQNGFKEYPENFKTLVTRFDKMVPDTGKMANQFTANEFNKMDEPLFVINNNKYRQGDFVSYAETLTRGRIMGQREASLKELYKMYVDKVVNDVQEHKLEEENQDFKNLMQEYRDGIMLFELMDQQVWGKASRDSAGLQAFYDAHKAKYQWEPGFEGAVYKFKNEDALKNGMKLLNSKSRMEDEAIADSVNTDAMPDAVSVLKGRYEFSKFKEANREALTKGTVTKQKRNDDGSYTVVRVDEVYNAPSQKTLEEARGYVIAEYQDYLEKQWNETLREKYPVKVETSVFNSMVR